jgi:hypothetical protein
MICGRGCLRGEGLGRGEAGRRRGRGGVGRRRGGEERGWAGPEVEFRVFAAGKEDVVLCAAAAI